MLLGKGVKFSQFRRAPDEGQNGEFLPTAVFESGQGDERARGFGEEAGPEEFKKYEGRGGGEKEDD